MTEAREKAIQALFENVLPFKELLERTHNISINYTMPNELPAWKNTQFRHTDRGIIFEYAVIPRPVESEDTNLTQENTVFKPEQWNSQVLHNDYYDNRALYQIDTYDNPVSTIQEPAAYEQGQWDFSSTVTEDPAIPKPGQ
ncbi:hypothetical protein ACMFMG_011941 [Clarireedia jacksonii]